MDDLIRRSDALEALGECPDNWCDTLEEIQAVADWRIHTDAIKGVKAVDAVPVVNGKWVRVHGYATPGGDPVWRCSACGKGMHTYGIEHGSYGASIADGQWVSCPNCGAKMDGEREGTDA